MYLRNHLRLGPFLMFVALLLVSNGPLRAGEVAAEPAEEAAPQVPETLSSPRATMATFLHAMNDIKRGHPQRIEDATATLDLSEVNVMVRTERGRDLAWELLEVMDHTRLVDLEQVPDRRTGEPYVFQKYQAGAVRISPQENGRWLFDAQTLESLPGILDEVAEQERVVAGDIGNAHVPWHIRMRDSLPDSLKRRHFVLETWRWLAILIIIALGVVADRGISLILGLLVRQWRTRTRHPEYQHISDQILRPLGLMAMAAIWWGGINMLGLPEEAMLVLLVAVKFLAGVSGVWTSYRLVDLLTSYLTEKARLTDNKLDDALVPLIPRILKLFITAVGVVFVADNLNLNVSSLLAGLGLGGLAFALAAKDMVQNLFGSIAVLMDRTFSVGDWIKVGDVEGTVELIGFRTTRIRTFYNSVITLPNSHFITAGVDNMGHRRYRRLSCKLGLAYHTPPDKIEAFCEGVRELVRSHPCMRKDYYHIYFNGFGESSLEILVYVFWETPDWGTELRERHRFLLDVLRLADRLGVEFAFPTRTLYMREGLSADTRSLEASQEDAFALGRHEAQQLVAAAGLEGRPPPVSFR